MHVADFPDAVIRDRHRRFFGRERGLRFFQSPGEVVAIVVHGIVGILRGVEAAMGAVAEPLVDPANDVAGDAGEERPRLPGRRVRSSSATRSCRNTSSRNAARSSARRPSSDGSLRRAGRTLRPAPSSPACGEHGVQMLLLVTATLAGIPIDHQVEGGRMRKLGGAAESAVFGVKHLQRGLAQSRRSRAEKTRALRRRSVSARRDARFNHLAPASAHRAFFSR